MSPEWAKNEPKTSSRQRAEACTVRSKTLFAASVVKYIRICMRRLLNQYQHVTTPEPWIVGEMASVISWWKRQDHHDQTSTKYPDELV